MNTASIATTSNSATNCKDEMKLPTRKQMIAAARSQYQSEGEIEIDDTPDSAELRATPTMALLFKHGFGFQMKRPAKNQLNVHPAETTGF